MRSRNLALGCALAGALGFAVLPPAHAASTAHAAGTARAVAARKAAPALSISTSATTYAFSSMVRLTVSMGRTHGNRAVSIYAAPVGLRQWLWHRGRVNFAGQLRDRGSGWDDDTGYGCDSLDGGSHNSTPFTLAEAAGARYRIRADYVRSARNLANLSADGPWLYLIVVK